MYALQTPFPTIKSLVRLYASYLTFAQHKHQTAKEVEYDKFKGGLMGDAESQYRRCFYLWNATRMH